MNRRRNCTEARKYYGATLNTDSLGRIPGREDPGLGRPVHRRDMCVEEVKTRKSFTT
jgi:hypothetical protein